MEYCPIRWSRIPIGVLLLNAGTSGELMPNWTLYGIIGLLSQVHGTIGKPVYVHTLGFGLSTRTTGIPFVFALQSFAKPWPIGASSSNIIDPQLGGRMLQDGELYCKLNYNLL